ncbi:MAG: sigma-70 family RNA polymerase sigma factor [Pseudomonadota bacterium]
MTAQSVSHRAGAPHEREAAFRAALIAEMSHVRAFARSLCAGRQEEADDIAQDALANAWAGRDAYTPSAPLRAWLFTIVRNLYRSRKRQNWRETLLENMEGVAGATSGRETAAKVELDDARRALSVLEEDQREALVLVAVAGFSVEEAAAICDTKPGTIKSRVSRARARLEAAYAKGEIGASAPDASGALDALIEEANARAAHR